MRAQRENEVPGVAIHIDLKPLSTRAWPTGRTHKFIVDGPCRSNARCSRTMLVIFSSIVSVPELAAAQSFMAFTTIASRAGRTRAARCLLAQHPRHTPMRGHGRPDAGEVGVDIVERRVRVSAEKQLLFQRAHPLLALVGRFHAHLVAAAPSAAASLGIRGRGLPVARSRHRRCATGAVIILRFFLLSIYNFATALDLP